jgi:hypothetical protein
MNARGRIADEQKVGRLFGSFQNTLIHDWICCKRATLATLSFPEFMKEFRRRWLPSDWEQTVRSQIIAARFDPRKEDKFETWVQNVQMLNIALRGTSSHLDDEQLRIRLEDNLDEELWRLAHHEKANKIENLISWIQKVGDIDSTRRVERKSAATVNPYPPLKRDASSESGSTMVASNVARSMPDTALTRALSRYLDSGCSPREGIKWHCLNHF